MGCGPSMSAEEKEAHRLNRQIEESARRDAHADSEKVKLLLLGAGESGKSTVFKQMRVLYGQKETAAERMEYRPVIHNNVLTAMKTLLEQSQEFGYQVTCKDSFSAIDESEFDDGIDSLMGKHVKRFWNDPGVQSTWDRRAEFQIVESSKPYFDQIDRLAAVDYCPTEQDILLSRVRTTGIVEEQYLVDEVPFAMYDVGGQRNERKKWIHCFENVTAVIFVAALSEYDQKLFEMESVNRMVEALDLFDDICNNEYFKSSSMLLFLNKRDLFQDKVNKVDINSMDAFSDYAGPMQDYDAGVNYFVGKFMEKNKNPNKKIYHHVTCATDTSNVQVVFNSCKDIILMGNLNDSLFM